jgi:peptidoglycan/xylan/chitin deacetylase (PgdA/CDA1 family)
VIKNFFHAVIALAVVLLLSVSLHPGTASARKNNPAPSPASAASIHQGPTLVVLGYHQFGSDALKGVNTYRLSPAELRWEFQWLKEHGWTPVTLDQVLAHWEKGEALPDKSVLLTYDDGYRSVFTEAFPVIRQFGYPGVLFLYTDFVKWESKLSLRHSDIELMEKSGLTAQSHSQSHPNMGLLKDQLTPEALTVRLKDEMEVSRDYLRDKLKSDPKALAYPYGVYNYEAVEAAHKAGYRMAFTVNPGPNDASTDPFHLHRYLVVHGTSHAKFAGFFDSKVLHVGKVEPADGEWVKTRKPVFGAKILDDVDPASVRMYLGEKPLKGPQYDPATGKLVRALRILLPHGGHLVTITAVDRKGVQRSFSWYFRIQKSPDKNIAAVSAPHTPSEHTSVSPKGTPTPRASSPGSKP